MIYQTKTVITVIAILTTSIDTFRFCDSEDRLFNYFKIKSCHRSTLPIILWKNVPTLDECKNVARERNGLAFNFIPPDAKNYTTLFTPNCQILGCPEIGNSSTLVMDLGYDYYSAFGNSNFSEDYTCIKSLGLFSLTNTSQNYSQSILTCQNMGGDLADITTELRTVLLSGHIKNEIPDWYKAAYVGLDDILSKGNFRTTSGKLLTCSNFRAWAPGHPRSKHKSENCVTMDSEKLWRVVRCNKVKLRGLCEMYPLTVNIKENIPKNITCHKVGKQKERKKCLRLKEMFQVYQNSSRADKCALLNFD